MFTSDFAVTASTFLWGSELPTSGSHTKRRSLGEAVSDRKVLSPSSGPQRSLLIEQIPLKDTGPQRSLLIEQIPLKDTGPQRSLLIEQIPLKDTGPQRSLLIEQIPLKDTGPQRR